MFIRCPEDNRKLTKKLGEIIRIDMCITEQKDSQKQPIIILFQSICYRVETVMKKASNRINTDQSCEHTE